jgi:hypothetical protein
MTEPDNDSEQDDPLKRRHRARIITLMTVMVVIVVSTIIAIAVVVTRNNNNQRKNSYVEMEYNSTTAVDETTNEDEGRFRFTKLTPFLEKINTNNSVAWEDPQSPQNQALHRLIYEDWFTKTAVNVFGIPDLDRTKTRYLL